MIVVCGTGIIIFRKKFNGQKVDNVLGTLCMLLTTTTTTTQVYTNTLTSVCIHERAGCVCTSGGS